MMDRCSNPNSHAYSNYGGRGVTVCERWRTFENFLADMGLPPFSGATLERVDNDIGYCPENVVWATRLDQNRNRRNTLTVDLRGVATPLAKVAEDVGIPYKTLWARLFRLNIPLERAIKKEIK